MQLIGHGRNVFFVPAYERLWYLGLGALSAARSADASARQEAYAIAVGLWEQYIESARSEDRWLAQAKSHAARARRLAGSPKKPQKPAIREAETVPPP
jgi:hypothetical protein